MILIAERPLYLGQFKGLVETGQSFEIDEYHGKQMLAEGKACVKPPTPVDRIRAGAVTCIMPTKDRRDWVPKAIACFQAQTFAARELLVIDNGESIADLIPEDPRIRYVRLTINMKTGALRNFACQQVETEFVAHWDDDDWYHPERLAEQIVDIDGAQVVAYRDCYFHGDGKTWLYSGPTNCGIGSSLLYRRSWWDRNRFQPIQVSEDVQFVERARGVIKLADGRRRMVASIHAANTSPRVLTGSSYSKASEKDLPTEFII